MTTCVRKEGSVWTSCICPDCRALTARNSKLYRCGRSPIHDTRDQALERFRRWVANGYSSRVIAELTGLSERTVQAMMQGRTSPGRMQHKTAAKILAAADEPTGGGWVPAIGSTRRLRALTYMGWSMDLLAEHCGVQSTTLAAIRSGRFPNTRPRFAKAIKDAYEELWDQPGHGRLASARARNRGWFPPLAWDDDTIDDPNAQPDTGTATQGFGGRASVDTADNVRWYLDEIDGRATAQQVAERLGYRDANPLYVALRRAGADDLRDRLTRNTRDAADREFSPPPRRPRPASERQSA